MSALRGRDREGKHGRLDGQVWGWGNLQGEADIGGERSNIVVERDVLKEESL